VLTAVTCSPITRTHCEIHSEVEVGTTQGLSEPCVIDCDSVYWNRNLYWATTSIGTVTSN